MNGSFLDSNVVLYAASGDAAKAARAIELLERGAILSVQVLTETAHVLRRKFACNWHQTHAFLETVRALTTVVPTSLNAHLRGLALAQRHGFSVWDAMIVATALDAGCDRLWSEDMQHGLMVDGQLAIINPFRGG
jgi:predicted nucleic acid-binding protein